MPLPLREERDFSFDPEELRSIVLEAGRFMPGKHRAILLNLYDLEHITVLHIGLSEEFCSGGRLGDYNLLPLLRSLDLPTLIVHGRRDPIPLVSSEEGARAMSARFLVLEASGHVPYVEQPAALFSAITQFLEDTSALAG